MMLVRQLRVPRGLDEKVELESLRRSQSVSSIYREAIEAFDFFSPRIEIPELYDDRVPRHIRISKQIDDKCRKHADSFDGINTLIIQATIEYLEMKNERD